MMKMEKWRCKQDKLEILVAMMSLKSTDLTQTLALALIHDASKQYCDSSLQVAIFDRNINKSC